MTKKEENKTHDNQAEKFDDNYYDTLNSILESDDENAKDNMSDYMDELKEESDTIE